MRSIPSHSLGKAGRIRSLTQTIKRLGNTFLGCPNHVYDRKRRQAFAEAIDERGVLIQSLAEQDPDLCRKLIIEVETEMSNGQK